MTDLELFARAAIEKGDEWHTLETCSRGKLFKCIHKYEYAHNYYNDVIYQVFNSEGKRVFSNVSYLAAYNYYLHNIIEGGEEDDRQTIGAQDNQ